MKVKLKTDTRNDYLLKEIFHKRIGTYHRIDVVFKLNCNGYYNQISETEVIESGDWDYFDRHEQLPLSYRYGYTKKELEKLMKKEGYNNVL